MLAGVAVPLRRGPGQDHLEPGTKIIVHVSNDHSLKRANGRDVAIAGESKILQGWLRTGEPYEERLLKARRENGRC